MSIKINFQGVSILKPGAYSVLNTTLLTDTQLGDSGIIGIIGEADGGEPGVLDIISPAGFQEAKQRYKSGPIAKAFELLANPSNDPRIPSGASRVVIFKTNNSAQSSKNLPNNQSVPANVLALQSLNYGVDENNVNILLSQGSIADENASIVGTIAGPFTLAGSETIIINHGGSAYTYTSSLGAGSKTLTEVKDDINNSGNWAPSKPVVASEETVGASVFLKLTLSDLTDASKLEYGIMNVDAASTLDTIVGLANTNVRGIKGNRIIIENKDSVTNTSSSIGGEEILEIQYTGVGTAAVLAVQDVSGVKTLTTTVTGGPGSEDLSIDLTNVSVEQLVSQINASSVYTCSSTYFNKASQTASGILDYYSNLDIDLMAAKLYNSVIALHDYINSTSQFFSSTLTSNVVGHIATISSAEYFTGGTKGVSTNTDFQSGFDALKGVRINTIVPLVSKDGSNGSTYTIDSVNAQADAHCNFMSSILGKSERNCYVSKNGTKDVIIAAARALNSRHTSMVAQQPTALDEFGSLIKHEEYALACLCAGMQAGSPVGEPITFKLLRIFALDQDSSWDARIDFDEMIEAGLTIAEQTDTGTFRVILGNTTYSKDGNLVFNRISINEAANHVAYELRTHLESLFVGTKARTGTAEAIKNAAISKLEQLRDEDIIVDGNEDDGTIIPAFRNIQVSISGVTCELDVTVTPVPGIDFKLQTIYLTSLQASASA